MANTLITPSVIARKSLKRLTNNLVMGGLVHREYKNEFVKVGDTVSIRKPVKFLVSDGAARSNQDVTETSVPFVINKRKHVSWKFTASDLTLKIEEYDERYIKPAIDVLADQVDFDLLALGTDIYNSVGTPGTTPNAFSMLGDAATKLDDEATPQGDRSVVFNPKANWTMADALKTLLNASMNTEFVRKGMLGTIAGADVYSTQNVTRFLTGPKGGSPTVTGGGQTGSTLITGAWTAAAAARVTVGDVFTIANVFAVNPLNKASTGVLRQFVVATGSTLASDAGGALTLTISPAITTGTAYQNVNAGPAGAAALTFIGTAATTYPQNLMFHKTAFGLVTVPLELPDSAGFKARAAADNLSIRVVKDYDIDADEEIIRLDILYGVKTLYPEMACRIWG